MKRNRLGRSRLVGALVAGGALAGAIIQTSPAGATVAASVTVSAGTLGVTFPATISFSGVTLSGVDQTSTGSYAVDVKDATGSGTGWKLQLTSTTFTSGAHTLPTSATTITAAPTGGNLACDSLTTCTLATTNVSFPYTVPAAVTAPTATTFFNATANTGMGNQTATVSFSTAIAANTFASGTPYTSTWTFSQVSGP